MHVAFIPYGARWEVEYFLRELEAQKFWLTLRKGDEEKKLRVSGFIKQVPFGIYEYCFPKEFLDVVLTTMKASRGSEPYMSEWKKKVTRKMLRLKPIPKYDRSQKFFWRMDCIGIIVLGIREDKDVTDQYGEMIGWTHEGL